MISVVLPTMWRAPHIEYMIPKMLESSAVGEVIIIDNAPTKRPEIVDHPKLVWLPQETNQFVNPSWKIGVDVAKSDKLCIAEDDIVWNERVFDWIEPLINHTTVIGCTREDFRICSAFDDAVQRLGQEEITPYQLRACPMTTFFWGQLMFFHRERFIQPEPMFKIYMGDAMMFFANKQAGYLPQEIQNFKVFGRFAETVSLYNFKMICKNELDHIDPMIQQYDMKKFTGEDVKEQLGIEETWRLMQRSMNPIR